MPTSGKRWRHVIVNTRGSWLPGDPRGFRSRGHRIHSSGDYKHLPPAGEHEGLYFHSLEQSSEAIRIPARLRAAIGEAFRKQLEREGHCVLAAAVSAMHVHVLAELPGERAECRLIVRRCKRAACLAIEHELKGTIWAAGGEFRLIRDRAHQVNAYRYILEEQGEGAWVWSFRDEGR